MGAELPLGTDWEGLLSGSGDGEPSGWLGSIPAVVSFRISETAERSARLK